MNDIDKAQLGYATNRELIDELQCRWEMGSTHPDYSTMRGTPNDVEAQEPPKASLVGGPWHGRTVDMQGTYLVGPVARFADGEAPFTSQPVGHYEWARSEFDDSYIGLWCNATINP
jgi:hypothetical protein